MSKDPLEELFGLLDEAAEADAQANQPVSARERLSQEQSVRTHERQPDIPRAEAQPKQRRRSKRGAAALIAQAQTEAPTAALPNPAPAAPTTPIARTAPVAAPAAEAAAPTAPLPTQTARAAAAQAAPAPAAPTVPLSTSAAAAAPTAPLRSAAPAAPAAAAPRVRPAAAPRAAAPAPATPAPAYARNGGSAGNGGSVGGSTQTVDDTPQDARAKFMPWVVVGVVALVAIIGATFLIGGLRGGAEEVTPAPVEKVEPVAPTPDTNVSEDEKPEEVVEEPKTDEAPTVEVGATYPIPVPQWNASFDLSDRLGSSCGYNIEGENLVMCTDLVESFPESCSALRTGWGITRLADGKFELLRPEGTCADAKALYDNVWGLMQAAADSMKTA